MDEDELDRDRLVEAALHRLEDPVARADADWARLEGRIRWSAQGVLRRLRGDGSWWEETARWARAAIPLGVAAGIAALLAISHSPVAGPELEGGSTSVEAPSLFGALAGAAGERELLDAAIGSVSADMMLDTGTPE